ncbi:MULTISPECIES: antibiotic biosynthesis monooxygenase [unclassified Oceanobacter]|jgi:antibiotic biosynthesis monooxygenase (ABM) superfamily enzyme|uniref:antibiotic biosynthesis monooxygenase n=1 Tax=unclassified Oceanobacter TaxID=2620260 RepID=UPI0027374A6F|nr:MULTISPECIES: antibiotic biosynthesis monooxygenase [unclassified Oceanobacter]MDP2506432.1 antibiotic biosynthesis monooxygenase [Oceanobacter sp. 3_MG-2023]MDP2548983.1 antibiotic biosynthesis monooxygenase [Oceanobacter sp. 4_MG-2023]
MEPHSDTDGPVTVVISRRVIPGKESEFEQLSADMTLAASRFEGYLGTNLFRPASSDDPEYRIIFRFTSHAALNVWEASTQRAQLLGSIEALLSSPTQREITYGIANWFDLPGQPAANPQTPPAKYKMTIVSWMALYPIVTLVFFLFGEPLAQIPLIFRTLLVTAVVMVLMSYVAMPRMTRWFGFWLFPKRRP